MAALACEKARRVFPQFVYEKFPLDLQLRAGQRNAWASQLFYRWVVKMTFHQPHWPILLELQPNLGLFTWKEPTEAAKWIWRLSFPLCDIDTAELVREGWRDRREAEILWRAAVEDMVRRGVVDEHYLWRETVQRARTQGYLLFEIHRRPIRRRMDLLSRIPKKRRRRS